MRTEPGTHLPEDKDWSYLTEDTYINGAIPMNAQAYTGSYLARDKDELSY